MRTPCSLGVALCALALPVLAVYVPRAPEGRERAASAFRGLIDIAQEQGGSYYLTYHRHARKDQVLRSYPELPALLNAKPPGPLVRRALEAAQKARHAEAEAVLSKALP